MRRAFSYIRFSSPEQAKGDSFRRQTEFSTRYAEQNGLLLDESLNLRDLGVSAFRGKNVREGALAGFLEAVKSGRVPTGSVLIVESLDRLSRDQIRPALQLFLSILDAGVSIVTVKPEREYTPDDQDPLVLIEPLIYFSRAHEESQTKSGRLTESWEQRRKHAADKPLTGRCPEWLKLTQGRFVEVKEAADAVRLIFKLCQEGMGVRRITQTLTEQGVEPFGRSSRWNMSYVRKLLTFKAVCGEFQPHRMKNGKRVPAGDPIPNYYPAVVSEADFYAVQKTLRGRKNRGGRVGHFEANLLTGLAHHAGDKTTMFLKRPTGGEKKYVYLSSSAYLHGRRSVVPASFPYLPIEAAVLRSLTELRVTDVVDQRRPANDLEAEIDALTGEIGGLDSKLEKVTRQAEKADGIEPFLNLLSRLQKQKREKESRREQLRAAAAVNREEALDETQTLVRMMSKVSGEKLAQLRRRIKARLQHLVKEVWVLVEKHGRVRVAQVQVHLHNKVVKPVTVFHPNEAAIPPTFKPYTGDLREFQPPVQASTAPSASTKGRRTSKT
jgi:DNA invertase Pin-like site-specific DNA recombinase